MLFRAEWKERERERERENGAAQETESERERNEDTRVRAMCVAPGRMVAPLCVYMYCASCLVLWVRGRCWKVLLESESWPQFQKTHTHTHTHTHTPIRKSKLLMHTHDVAIVRRKQFFGGTTTTNDVVVHTNIKGYQRARRRRWHKTDARDVIGRTDGWRLKASTLDCGT